MYGESNERQLCLEIGSSVEYEIVRVISLSITEITEITRLKKPPDLKCLNTFS